jgi:hypothetical protein
VNILKMRKANQRRQGITFALGYRTMGYIDAINDDVRELAALARIPAWSMEMPRPGSLYIAPLGEP